MGLFPMWKHLFRRTPKTAPYITIVSGLPRSGTSMMMRMLEAGGMDVVMDNRRQPDADNPQGYYEFEPVKHLKEGAAFLDRAHGKAVKIVSMLLYDLPPDQHYKLLFMHRHLEEILASQAVMLHRQHKSAPIDDQAMGRRFAQHLREVTAWLAQQARMKVLHVDYNAVLHDPEPGARAVNQFLENCLDVQRMVAVVDHPLYRHRGG
jgi:hypothetical protein